MQAFQRITKSAAVSSSARAQLVAICCSSGRAVFSFAARSLSTSRNGDDEWNDVWESAWLPDDLSPSKSRAPWEADVNFPSPETPAVVLPSDADAATKAFVEEMNENWDERRGSGKDRKRLENQQQESGDSLYSMENMKKDYRLRKQRIHAGLWMKEIDKQEEAKFNDSVAGDDIEKLLDSCSDIFDSPSNVLENMDMASSTEFKNKPDGWETTSKSQDGNVWEMTQREEDILLQEFERRIAYSKFQIASFIKSHIFSRRRPIDGWKYMVEVIGPNAQKGKGSAPRVPSLADPSTQPFKEERIPIASSTRTSYKGR
ncbi:uncharacterized protein LOC116211662 [Punica granatum]|uniref:Uncharacterized protein LOC116211662 n=2 Tax=Punica granatum TaxID=22663 RepID=A0A6P8E647_PUNGR|nr:uncharacterized protein LOC116211662 [Punica granatum]PKI36839.1 hypothetical protein CRG98_042788 [Punica granatum]